VTQEYVPPSPPKTHAPRPKSLATTSLILGLLALIVSWLSLIGVVVSVLAVVLGIVARRKTQPQGLSVAGIITGGLGLVISIYLATTAGFFLPVEEVLPVEEDCACAQGVQEITFVPPDGPSLQ